MCSVQAICCRSNSLWHPWGGHGILRFFMERTPSMLEDSCGSKAKIHLASSDRCHYSCFPMHALSAAPSSAWAFYHWWGHDLLSLSIPIPRKHKCCFDGFHKYWWDKSRNKMCFLSSGCSSQSNSVGPSVNQTLTNRMRVELNNMVMILLGIQLKSWILSFSVNLRELVSNYYSTILIVLLITNKNIQNKKSDYIYMFYYVYIYI